MKLELGIMAGAETKAWLSDLTKLVERMEKAAAKFGGGGKSKAIEVDSEESVESESESESEEEEELDPAPKKGKKSAKAKSFEDEEPEEETENEEAEEEETEETEEEEAAPKKKTKAAKLTVDDVNDACMDRAGRTNRAEVLSILKMKFKVKSVTDLKPEQYEAVIKAMKARK